MNKNTILMAVATLGTLTGLGAERIVPSDEMRSVYVSDKVALDGPFVVSDNADLYKTGPGELTVNQSVLTNAPFMMKVLGGKVTLVREEAAEAALTPPSVIAEKAAVWLDAADSASLLDANGQPLALSAEPQEVAKWVDRRAATSPNAYPYFTASNALNTVAENVGRPRAFVTNGCASVHFRGYGSGVYMDLYGTDGKQKEYNSLYHAFFVHAVDANWGYILGRRAGDCNWYQNSNHEIQWISSMQILAPSVLGGSYTARWLLNGRWVDVFTTPPVQGSQLLEEHATDKLFACSALYASKAQTSGNQTGGKGAVGGDRLHEVIFFTCRLTETEQADVRDYLMRKWGLDYGRENGSDERRSGQFPQTYALAEGTTLEAAPTANAETAPIAFSGTGTVTKKGAGALVVGPSAEDRFGGTFDLQEGRVLTRGGRLPALAANGGDLLSAAAEGSVWSETAAVRRQNGAALTKATGGAAGVMRKTGTETARVNALAADVERVEVAEGELILEAPVTKTHAPPAIASDVIVLGTNLDFEASSTTDTWAWGTGTNGWWCYDTAANYTFGKDSLVSWIVPQGQYGLRRSTFADAYTPVTFPAAGTYEISFNHTARAWQNTLGDRNRTVTDVGIAKYVGDSPYSYWGKLTRIGTYRGAVVPWPRIRFRFTVAEAGKYMLGFEGRNMSGVDNHVYIDDIKFRLITDKAVDGAYEIQNGDFEQIPADAFNRTAFCLENQSTGWTFTQPANITDCRIGTIEPRNDGSSQFLSGDPRVRGNVQLQLIGTAGVARTTFTPPAGTWRLRGAFAHVNYYYHSSKYGSSSATLEARVTIGEAGETSLGKMVNATHALVDSTWPIAFTTDGKTPVTLALQCADEKAGLVADDFLLVPAEAVVDTPELVKNGSFEVVHAANKDLALNWEQISPIAEKNGKYRVWCRWSADKNYAPDIFEGKYYVRIQQNCGIQQTLTFSEAGLYRLRFAFAPRPGTSYGYNAIRALLRKESETTYAAWREIGRAVPGANAWVEREFLFRVPEAGAWVLAFEGMGYLQCKDIKAGNDQSNCDHTSCLDCVSVRRVAETFASTPALAEGQKPKLRVAKNARLTLDYDGCITVRSLRLNGVSVPAGVVKSSDYPDYLGGRGEISVEPKSFVIFVK